MKRIVSFLCASSLVLSSFIVSAYAKSGDALLSGEVARKVQTLYPGVSLTEYSLSRSSDYNLQEFSTVEFDPSQDDLYLDVMGGGKYANNLSTVTDTVERYNSQNEYDRTAIAAVNGDMWLMTGYHVRVLGKNHSYDGYSDPVVTKSLQIPRGFTMYNGEIICTSNMEQETPYNGRFQSFAVNTEGKALLGDITCNVRIRDKTSGTSAIKADGINRLPANDALVLYTDKGYASNCALSDAYEVVIDCPDGYVVKQSALISGEVTAISKPNTERQPMKEGRLILTARGSAVSKIDSFRVGDSISISVSVKDEMGNTSAWQKVTDCVGGHMPIVVDGKIGAGIEGNNTYYPTSILGIKENGNVVMLTSYGRQGSTSVGYSYGFKISTLPSLCEDLGIVSAFLLDGGGSAAMVADDGGEYKLTGRPCDKFADGSYGKERTVINSVVLSYGTPRYANSDAYIFDSEDKLSLVEISGGLSSQIASYSLAFSVTGRLDPNLEFSYLGADATAKDYAAITLRAPDTGQALKLGLFAQTGDTYTPVYNAYRQIEFDSVGEWQTLVIKMSDLDAWYGKIFRLKLVLSGDSLKIGDRFNMNSVRLFSTLTEAEEYAKNPASIGDVLHGDATGDSAVNASDAVAILRHVASWNTPLGKTADYDCNGTVNSTDAVLLLRSLTSTNYKIYN